MNTTDIFKLKDTEKIVLVEKIWDSICTINIELTDAVKTELDNRLDKLNEGKTIFFTPKELKNRLKSLK